MGGYALDEPPPGTVQQLYIWDEDLNLAQPPKRTPSYRAIDNFFVGLDYSKISDYTGYWESIKPANTSEVFQRWLFAFMSVHTSWQANIIGYEKIKKWWQWMNKPDELLKLLEDSRIGMHNNRCKFVSEFSAKFWENPSEYMKRDDETWPEFRDRLKGITLGLGPAKTSFALELCYPNEAKITCLDTHIFQAYGLDQTKDARLYDEVEQHWVEMSNMWNIPPYIARCFYWDAKQGYTDSRYWSYTLEGYNK